MAEELYCKVINMWKEDTCFFWIFFVLLGCEIPYITSIHGTDEKLWFEYVNYFYVFLWALPALSLFVYIMFRRTYMPKAPKNIPGIAVLVINANERQYESIIKKFIAPFKKAINSDNMNYCVVEIDAYHSEKYYPVLYQECAENLQEKKMQILQKRRCQAAILIDCKNGGEGEALFCHMEMKVTVMPQPLTKAINDLLARDISVAFLPLKEIDIMKISETTDFSKNSISLAIVCRYIMASTCFHCGNFCRSLVILENMERKLQELNEIPKAIIPIYKVLEERIAICYSVITRQEYDLFCNDNNEYHLKYIENAIANKHYQKVYNEETKIYDGICSFVLHNNILYAIQCMDSFVKTLIARFNKVFLLIYEECTDSNVFRAYKLYKSFKKLGTLQQEQIENFICNMYKRNRNKKQLLFLLFLIYDQRQNNDALAKKYLDMFCNAFPTVISGSAAKIFDNFKKKYQNVDCIEYEEDYE